MTFQFKIYKKEQHKIHNKQQHGPLLGRAVVHLGVIPAFQRLCFVQVSPIRRRWFAHYLFEHPAEVIRVVIAEPVTDFRNIEGGISHQVNCQSVNVRFIPLYEIKDETYTVYFPVSLPIQRTTQENKTTEFK
ncbi:hypothetical protein [Fontibacillus panacisegetis]|uniref:hypothetical protein n=1 Tax=Fontibacillus panacisegetis TaxID=670482 RepID=UPI003CCBB146